MTRPTVSSTNVSLAPLGAGDLIDRAVRFYRGNFQTFVLIAAPPVVMGTLISVAWMFLGREIFSASASRDAFETTLYYVFLWFGGQVIKMAEIVATLVVMGGAARSFVRYLLFGEPITFKETYQNVWRRLGGLIVAAVIITFILYVIGIILSYVGVAAGALGITAAMFAFSFSPFIAVIVSLIIGLAVVFGVLWLFFLVASRFAYAPQIMLVEGLGVFAAMGRSASLAGGNVRRLAALFVFTTVATYSALLLFYVPLGWYAWASGIEFFSFDADAIPAWYEIANQVLSQASLILLTPVWMIGLCLLYIDERVRHEGYDIELMAARRLGEIPAVPQNFQNPLQPALNESGNFSVPHNSRRSSSTILGLE